MFIESVMPSNHLILCHPVLLPSVSPSWCMRILQARILKWAAMPFSRGSSQPRDRTQVSHIAGRFFTIWATREAFIGEIQFIFFIYKSTLSMVKWFWWLNEFPEKDLWLRIVFHLKIFALLAITILLVLGITKVNCREPEWGTPPLAKVMRKEDRHTQRRDRASGVPLEILEHLPPKPESAYFTALCSYLHLWLYRGLSPTTSLREEVNLELQLIITPGHDRSVSTYKLLWRFSSLPDRFVRPHVIVHSLPTVRGTRCFKPSKNRLFWDVRKLLV